MVVKVINLSKIYSNGTKALKGVDLSIESGEVVGLIGPNGAGKTTLVKILLGILNATSGNVRLWDHDPYQMSFGEKTEIGFLLEERGIYGELTVEENLTFWSKLQDIDGGRVKEALQEWSLWEKRAKQASSLSAGMKQKLAIARSVLNDPTFIIMDEPTSSLDPAVRKQVVDLLRGYKNRGKTLLITSHDLFDIQRICERIVLLRQGEITVQGTMKELKRNLGVGREVRVKLSKKIPSHLKRSVQEKYNANLLSDNELTISGVDTDTTKVIGFLVKQGMGVKRVEEEKITLEDIYTTILEEDEEK